MLNLFRAWKAQNIVKLLYHKGALNLNERNASIEVLYNYYFKRIQNEEQLVQRVSREYDKLCHPLIKYEDSFVDDRKVLSRLLVPQFRRRIFDFCFDYIIPLANGKKLFP